MLPVLEVENQLMEALRREGRAVLTAPTGSGKTTQTPQMLLRASITDGHIVVLQPRRLATRMVAQRVAHEMGCAVGSLVGYQTRHESRVSNQTRIRFMTEGLLLRMIQADVKLSRVGVVVLDEFHERNVAADIALGLLRTLQQTRRPDLRLLVMSATLDAAAVAAYLQCPSLHAQGRTFPIDVRYETRRSSLACWDAAAQAVASVLGEHEGDVLVFMPGAYEIGRTIESCKRLAASRDIGFFPLHGSLPPAQQDAAVGPCEQRKVIVATNVAETSITIEGVRCVVDSGLARVHRYDAERGVNVLRVEPISRASADQRAGRAGRTAPGVCLRLWTQADHHQVHPAHDLPEIQRIELAEPLLQLRAMGVDDPAHFPWLDVPPAQAVGRGETLLRELDATGGDGQLTATGSRMAEFPAHPRISRMLLAAAERGCLVRAVRWAALIGDRDILTSGATRDVVQHWVNPDEPASDLAVRERALLEAESLRFDPRRCGEVGLHANTCREVMRVADQLTDVCRRLGMRMEEGAVSDAIQSLLAGYEDHLAMKLDAQRPHCEMDGRRKVVLDKASVVKAAGLIVAVELREVGRGNDVQTSLALANEVDPAWLEPGRIETKSRAAWNDKTQAVEQVEERVYRGLVLDRTARPEADAAVAEQMLVDKIAAGELKLSQWDEEVERWVARVRCVAEWFPEKGLIRYEPDDVRVVLHELVAGATRFSAVRDKPCLDAMRNALSWDERRFVEKMAPAQVKLPRGWGMKVEYEPGKPPRGRAKIQDLYDLTETPKVAGGRQTILLEILGPNQRPLQVTSDLANFWKTLYPQLRNELKRRYPRHEWR